MALKDRIKILILSRYKSIRAFCVANEINYTTFMTALENGLPNASVTLVKKVSAALGIDMETLVDEDSLIKLGIYTEGEQCDEEQMLKNLKRKYLLSAIAKADDKTIDKIDKIMEIMNVEEWN